MCPIGTLGTGFTFAVVDALFVRTADEPVEQHHALHVVLLDKVQDLLVDDLVEAHIGRVREPLVHCYDPVVLVGDDDADDHFRGEGVIRAVIGDGRNRIPSLPVGLLFEPIPGIALRAHPDVTTGTRDCSDEQ